MELSGKRRLGAGSRSRACVAALLVGLVVLASGCLFFQEAPDSLFEVHNETSQTVTIRSGGGVEWGVLEPGDSLVLDIAGGRCGQREWVAEDGEGSTLATLEPPVCEGDVWVIEEP